MHCNYDLESEIVISGIAGRFPNSSNLDEFWQNLINGEDLISDNIDRYNVEEYDIPSRLGLLKDIDKFDAEFFSVHAKQAAAMDPRIRILLEITYEALVDAGINPVTIQGSRTGVFVSGAEGEAGSIWKRSATKPNIYGILGYVGSMMANRLSYTFDLRGPSYVIDTACSTTSVAVQQAVHSIRTGICDAAIVAGAHTHHDPVASYCFSQLKMTSKDGKCKSFDASADGYVRAEAAAALYICKRQFAKRSYATVVHAVTNNDGYKEQGVTFPSEVQQERVIRRVYEECGVDPLEVDYLEAHGTGTKVGDPEEMIAVTKVFCEGRKGPLLVGSVKSNMGHSEPLAGLCSIAKVILAHSHGILPANLNYKTPNPDIPSLHDGRIQIVDRNQPFNAKYVGINSMGFGGTNVHTLLKMEPKDTQPKTWKPAIPLILVCSGRTSEAVQTFLQSALTHHENQGFVNLTHLLHARDTPKHQFRGYVVVDPEKVETQVDNRGTGRTIWFIFTGLGSQWAGMSKDLIKFSVFKQSVEKSASVLANNNFDIISLLKCGDPEKFLDFRNSVVSITTIQIALVDLLASIGIQSDGIIGHSTGEVAAGYADGCLTQAQAVLTSMARVRAVLESNLPPGTVASVGLSWEEAQKRCPPGVYTAIHNSKENVTVAGPPDVINAFVKELESEGIFAKPVRSASFGFHSPLVEESGKLAKIFLEEIIPDPKPRSKKWLSSSVPEDKWDTDLAKYCSAGYYVNNGVRPVYFYTTLLHMPENAIALEIAPHCFMQTILKQSLPKSVVKLGLIHCKSPDNGKYFLDAMGKCFLAGVNINFAALYDPVQYPVSPAAPNISSLIRWDHSNCYEIPHHTKELSRQKGVKYSIHLLSEHDAFLEGHSIDGKILFPATGYLWIAWRFFAQHQDSRLDSHAVVFGNVRFERVTLLNKRTETHFLLNIFPASGKFEISESDMLVCSGIIRNVEESAANEMLNYEEVDDVDLSGPFMEKEDFYKEMHLRGYGHSGQFQGIQQADMQGRWAKVSWLGEWISFLDAVLQTFLLRNESRDLYVPIRLQKLTIDPVEVKKHLEASDNLVTVKAYEVHKAGMCPGMELRGISFAKFNQRTRHPHPATVEQVFLPYLEPAQIFPEMKALESTIEIVVENSFGPKFLLTEMLKSPKNMVSHLAIGQIMMKFSLLESRIVNDSEEAVDEDTLNAAGSKVISLAEVQSREHNHLVFVDDESKISTAAEVITANGFVLHKGVSLQRFSHPSLSLISEKCFLVDDGIQFSYYLLRKSPGLPAKTKVILAENGFGWVEAAKQTIKNLSDIDRLYFASQRPQSGIIGFVKCLVKEVTSEKIRCFHAIDQLEIDFCTPSDKLQEQIQKDLVYNVYKKNAWGTFSNLTIPKEEFMQLSLTNFAYADAMALGDLSSLSWIESPLKLELEELVNVHYSALNFRDIMLASGKLVQDALSDKTVRSDCVLGLEFSGMYQGKRVCGVGLSECLATRVAPKAVTLIDIPDSWTFEEAATVPCVYITVYLALILRGRMQPGESILIHAGSGGVGQAAIQVALSMNCRVFTTVSTIEKREFLKSRFPGLRDDSFANSRDARDFERHIQKHTKGRGVDLVLNCLAQDKLHASIRCLATNGRFLEIGKFDVFNDTNIGLSILSKGVSIFGILADQLLATGAEEEIEPLREYLQDGMKSGAIKPLTYHVFKQDQLEEAFRFMAQGKHMGKVLIQTKDDDRLSAAVPAMPRTYFLANKSYVLIGGLGGMGFELANWMVERGAKKLILASRSGATSTYHKYHMDLWERQGVELVIDLSDASTIEGTKCLLQKAQKLAPIGGIFNVAIVLRDALFEKQTQNDFEEVVKCKAEATMHLDSLSRDFAPELDYFVVFSSIVTARGNPGQTIYGYANAVMERICEERKAEDLPALAVQWGAVGDVGVFHRTMKDRVVFGLAPQNLKSCLATLDLCLNQDRTIVSSFVPVQRKDMGAIDPNESLVNIAANILGIKDVSKVNPKTPLVELGMDSLMAAELGQALQTRVNLQLSQKEYTQMTFEKLAEIDAKGNMQSENRDGEAPQMLSKQLTLRRLPENAISKMESLATKDENLFIVHPAEGTVVMLEELASHLEANVYGIESAKLAPLESMEKLAAYYVQKVKEMQPSGPYQIAGYSLGASIAFEMALQLESQNETVSLLMLLDGSPRWKHIIANIGGDAKRAEWETAILISFLQHYIPDVSVSTYKDLAGIESLEDKLKFLTRTITQAFPEFTDEEIKDIIMSFLARIDLAKVYDPSQRVKARTVLLKALKTGVDKDVAYDYGLSDICQSIVEVIEIDGNHYCFYENPVELGIAAIINGLTL